MTSAESCLAWCASINAIVYFWDKNPETGERMVSVKCATLVSVAEDESTPKAFVNACNLLKEQMQ